MTLEEILAESAAWKKKEGKNKKSDNKGLDK
jgi:hypothetical protein